MKAANIGLFLLGILFINCACAMNESNSEIPGSTEVNITSENIPQIFDIEWALLTIKNNNLVILKPTESKPTLTFQAENKIAGNASINRYFGSYKLNLKGVLSWQEPGFATTMMAGPPELMEQEQLFLQNLQNSVRIVKMSNGLKLENVDGSIQLLFQQLKK